MFGSIGMTELIVIMVVALVVIGPKRLPELARTLGKALGDFKRATSDFQSSFSMEDDYDLDVLDEDAKKQEKKESDEESGDADEQDHDETEVGAAEHTAEPNRTETDDLPTEAGDAAPEAEAAATESEAAADKTEPAREDDKQT